MNNMSISEFKKTYEIKKLSYKEPIKKAIERISYDEAWASWYYDEVILVYNNIIKDMRKNKF
jgi:hypothetical protein